eukprot:1138839-Pelagomonas_calceolata.AAC.9
MDLTAVATSYPLKRTHTHPHTHTHTHTPDPSGPHSSRRGRSRQCFTAWRLGSSSDVGAAVCAAAPTPAAGAAREEEAKGGLTGAAELSRGRCKFCGLRAESS